MSPLTINTVDLRRRLDALPGDGPIHVILDACARWSDDGSRFGSAIAFHAVYALAGWLLLGFAAVGAWLPVDAVWLAMSIQDFVGSAGAQRLALLLEAASRHSPDAATLMLAGVLAAAGTAGVWLQLRRGFNAVGNKPLPSMRKPVAGRHAAGIAVVCAAGLAVLLSLATSAALAWLGESLRLHLPDRVFGPTQAMIFGLLDLPIAFALLAPAFAALLRLLPDSPAELPAAWMAAAVAAACVALLTHFLGHYLMHADASSVGGMVEAAMIGMLSTYCGAQMLLIAAALAIGAHAAGAILGNNGAAPAPPASLAKFRAHWSNAIERGRPASPPQGKPGVVLQFPKR